MRLVIFHYHLNQGGVTSVVRSHLQALATVAADIELEEVALAYCGRATGWSRDFESGLPFHLEHLIIPSLEYDDLQTDLIPGRVELTTAMEQAFADRGYDPRSTVLHAHNHALGKNVALPKTLRHFASEGWRVLLQVHDFVEDLRPANYTHLLSSFGDEEELWSTLYPQAAQIHYATLNQSDHTTLASAGIRLGSETEARLHLLPNPVTCDKSTTDNSTSKAQAECSAARRKLADVYSVPVDRPYVLYPVRGIRRKNLGELLLWSLLLGDCTLSVTLEPKNEAERRSYLAWKEFSESMSLPILFGSGELLSLDENYAAADAIISTSVAEGFGLVFLEAALRDRPLFGRNLPGVTADFIRDGMRFPGLADELLVPCDSLDMELLRSAYDSFSKGLQADYGCSIDESGAFDELLQGEHFDFGRLDTKQQQTVISKAHADPDLVQRIAEKNPVVALARRALLSDDRTSIDASGTNRVAIEQHYSLGAIGGKLASIYEALLKCDLDSIESNPHIGRNLLRHFVRPEHLLPLRIES